MMVANLQLRVKEFFLCPAPLRLLLTLKKQFMEELFQMLDGIYPLSDGLKEYLMEHLKEKRIARKELLLKAGRICENIYFVAQGLLRCYYVRNGKEISTWFMKEGDVIASVESFFDQKPSYENIEALEDCVLYYVSHSELSHIYKTYLEFNYVGRELVQNYYKLSEKRLFSIRDTVGVEKMEFLLANHPDLISRVEGQHLASYLSITKEYFSILKPQELKRNSNSSVKSKKISKRKGAKKGRKK